MSALHRVEYDIAPPKSAISIDWPELWRFRDLFLVMSWRDLSVRYKQTALGVLWAVFQPLLTTVVFTVVFGRTAKIPTSANLEEASHIPYPVFVLVGLVCWQFYQGTITKMSEAMVANAQMIQKVYFPRLIIPGSMTISGLVDMGIVSVILGIVMAIYGIAPHLIGIAILPLLILTLVLTAVGQGLFCSALNVRYRDVRYALPFIVQTLMFVTPVIYPVNLLDSRPALKMLMIILNPIAGVITNARIGLIESGQIDWGMLAISLGMGFVYLILGLLYFRKTERHFADIV